MFKMVYEFALRYLTHLTNIPYIAMAYACHFVPAQYVMHRRISGSADGHAFGQVVFPGGTCKWAVQKAHDHKGKPARLWVNY